MAASLVPPARTRPNPALLRPIPEAFGITIRLGARATEPSCILTGGDTQREVDTGLLRRLAIDLLFASAYALTEANIVNLIGPRRDDGQVQEPDEDLLRFLNHVKHGRRDLGYPGVLGLYPHAAPTGPETAARIDLYFADFRPLTVTPVQAEEIATEWLRMAALADYEARFALAVAETTQLGPAEVSALFQHTRAPLGAGEAL